MNIPVDVTAVFEGKEYTLEAFKVRVKQIAAENETLKASLTIATAALEHISAEYHEHECCEQAFYTTRIGEHNTAIAVEALAKISGSKPVK